MPRVSYHQNNENICQKPLFRNLGVNNCIENYRQYDYKENIISDKNINNEKNKFLFLFRLNSQNNLNFKSGKNDKTNENENMSPYKFENSIKNINNNSNFQKNNDSRFKKIMIILKEQKRKILIKIVIIFLLQKIMIDLLEKII